jgi:hypothetical protein
LDEESPTQESEVASSEEETKSEEGSDLSDEELTPETKPRNNRKTSTGLTVVTTANK